MAQVYPNIRYLNIGVDGRSKHIHTLSPSVWPACVWPAAKQVHLQGHGAQLSSMGKVDESSWQGSQTVIATPVQNRAARVAAVELEEPSDEQPKDATAASPSPSKIAHIESRPDGLKYACHGAGVQCATVREAVRFEIVAFFRVTTGLAVPIPQLPVVHCLPFGLPEQVRQ